MSDELDKDFDFTDGFSEGRMIEFLKENWQRREEFLKSLDDADFIPNTQKVEQLFDLIELFESIAERGTSPYDAELYHGVNVEIFPVEIKPRERGVYLEVDYDSMELTPDELEIIQRAIEPDGVLETHVKTYGKTRLAILVPDVYTPKEQ